MDDLELITFVELKLRPTVARSNLAVQFDCNAIRLHPQTLDETGEGKRGVEVLDVPIYLDFHVPRTTPQLCANGICAGAASGVCGLHEDGRIWRLVSSISTRISALPLASGGPGVERRRIWTRKSKRQASSLNRRARFGHAKMHMNCVSFVH